MDLKDLTITTCLYYDLFGTEFGGRVHPRYKYFYGLLSMLKMDCGIALYCWEKNIEELTQFIVEEGYSHRLEQIKFIPYDLYKSPLYNVIRSIKNIEEQKKSDRTYDLMQAKFLMTKDTILNNPFNTKYFYYMDVGLSSCALFPFKYLPFKDHMFKKWSDCSLFDNNLVDALINQIKLDENRVLLWLLESFNHWIDPEHLNTIEPKSIIGGLFGGTRDPMIKFCDDITERFIDMVSNKNTLYLDEVIMTIEYNYNKETYNTKNFDVWYHEDSGDWCQDAIIGKKSFYKTFEEIINNGN
jgi:hypothetical protein